MLDYKPDTYTLAALMCLMVVGQIVSHVHGSRVHRATLPSADRKVIARVEMVGLFAWLVGALMPVVLQTPMIFKAIFG